MALKKSLDFNSLQRPTLTLTMPDDAHTVIEVCTPNQTLVKELQDIAPNLSTVYQSGDTDAAEIIYDLASRLMSCNRGGIEVTAKDLHDKYHMELEEMIIFFNTYVDFLNEIKEAKN